MPEIQSFAETAFQSFSGELKAAISGAPLPSLGDGPIDSALVKLLDGDQINDHLGALAGNHDECLSGLWLLAGDIDRSHTISQDLPSSEGSFLHGIMHRREGDFGNAKYWFRRVGSHPVLTQIADIAGEIYAGPTDFVDACQAASRSGTDAQRCQEAQWVEWQCLMAYVCEG